MQPGLSKRAHCERTEISDPFAEAFVELVGPEMAGKVLDEFRTGWHAEQVLARARQERIAAATAHIERKAIDGIGECVMQLDPTVYHFWGQKLGYQCWSDKEFRRKFLLDNPQCKVKTTYKARSNGWRGN